MLDQKKYNEYLAILKEELVPAMGCTEPIALAYAAAKAREILGSLPERVEVEVSGSIIKNVKSVIVPNTGHLKGIAAAVAAGIVAGEADRELEVISQVDEKKRAEIRDYLDNVRIEIEHIEKGHIFDIWIKEYHQDDCALVRIADYHTNIVLISKNAEILFKKDVVTNEVKPRADRSLLNVADIYQFANIVNLDDVKELISRQISYNNAIAEEGLMGDYGANIGSVLLNAFGNSVSIRAKAKAAAGSDARMNGCELPVIINSGSGNQGITCSVPLIEYAKELSCSKDKLYRALVLANLVTIHEKTGIGTLSAYCGAVSAGAGAGAGIAYLYDGDLEIISKTISNALAIVSGIVCDGAKASCAAKIASSVDAGILGFQMAKRGQEFKGGDGIVMKDIESTIRSISTLGSKGMSSTNDEIIRLMIQEK